MDGFACTSHVLGVLTHTCSRYVLSNYDLDLKPYWMDMAMHARFGIILTHTCIRL